MPYTFTYGSGFTYTVGPDGPAAPVAAAAVAPVVTVAPPPPAINPLETTYAIFGHNIPLYVFGKGRIGGELISGPWHDGDTVSGGISFGVPADPSGTRTLLEIAFDSEVVWTLADGFTTEAFTFRWYDGTLTQSADPLETAHFGAEANAYRPQTMLFVENLPLANTKFRKFPYIACKFSDSSGDDVNLGEAFERLAYGPFCGLTSDQFETVGITDGLPDGGLIIVQPTEFLDLIQQFGRFYSQWDILQTDKLRVVDRSSVLTADIQLDRTTLTGSVSVVRQGQDTVKKDLELSTIDPDADYTIVPFKVQRPRDPVAVTTSVGTDGAYLPAIMNASTRAAIATLARYYEEQTRKTITGTAMAYGLQIEPGTLVTVHGLSDDFNDETFKIFETLRGINNTVEFSAKALLKCHFADSVGCSAATDFLARTSGLDAAHTAAYIELICGLVEDGVWDTLDVLYVFATQDSTTALLNLKSTSFNGTINGAPTFTADLGFTGVEASTSDYIDTGFNPASGSPEYTRNSAHVSLWNLSSTLLTSPPATILSVTESSAIGSASGSTSSYIRPKYSNDTYFPLNVVNNAGQSISSPGPTGHFIGVRSDSVTLAGYRNGSALYSNGSQPSVAVLNQNFYALAINNGGTALGCGLQVPMVSIGSEMNATQAANFYDRLRTYMTAVGVP